MLTYKDSHKFDDFLISTFPRFARHHISTFGLCTTFVHPLTTEAAKTTATVIVDSRVDYCNSLLTGTSVSNRACLQLVQNTIARVVAHKSRYCHITPVLHCTPACTGTPFARESIHTTAFKVLYNQQPLYLAQIFPRYITSRSLRFSSFTTMSAPLRKTSRSPHHFKICFIHCIWCLE